MTSFRSQIAHLLHCVRWADILILQGPPLLGLAASVGLTNLTREPATIFFLLASLLLVIHVFTFNDWVEQPNASALLVFSLGTLAVSLTLCLFLSRTLLCLAGTIAALGIFYSHPSLNGKGMPIVSTFLHLVGGWLYFLFGYAFLSPIDQRGLQIGLFFGLTFAAGHPIQEARDVAQDRQLNVKTNAVVFGIKPAFAAGIALFTLQYACLFLLAWAGTLPRLLFVLPAIFFPIQLVWSLRIFRGNLSPENIIRFQNRYRLLYAAIGLTMLLAFLHSPLR